MTSTTASRCAAIVAVAALSACGPAVTGQSAQAPPIAARGSLSEAEQATIALFDAAAPSVVQVASRGEVTAAPGLEEFSAGSGFVWDEAGHIVTNNHVVEAPNVAVRLPSGEVVLATVIGRARQYDIAVLRLERPIGARPLQIGRSADLKVGQAALAIGNPFGLDETLTTGVISALGRRIPTPDGREIMGVIQTDAAINPGNSGGPLLDSAGRVIGVATAIYSPSGANAGVGFAIPIDTVARIMPDLIARGHTATPGIGILAASEADNARLGVEGLMVWRVMPGSAAARAGLRGADTERGQAGDIILAVDGHPVRVLHDLLVQLERAGVGSRVNIAVLREGRRVQLSVNVEDIGDS